MTTTSKTGFIVVDVQNDFCEGGSLAVQGGGDVARAITRHLTGNDTYAYVVASRDFHVDPGDHFSDDPDFMSSWPVHCEAGSTGAHYHPDLDVTLVNDEVRKGAYSAAYSAFEGATLGGTDLYPLLQMNGITDVVIGGIATDYCVLATALAAKERGLTTTVRTDLCAGVAQETTAEALERMQDAGVRLR